MSTHQDSSIELSSKSISWLGAKPSGELFFEWNLRLLNSFFSEASEKDEVFLRVDSDYLNQIGQDIGGDSGFLKAVRMGPSSVCFQRGLSDKANELLTQRNSLSTSYEDPGDLDPAYIEARAPTYLPYLAALVRNFSQCTTTKGYYQNLADDLKLDENFSSGEMSSLEPLWEDLKKWTHEQKGKFGFFKKRSLGGYKRIGLPASQSIVKQHDLDRLPLCFVELQLKSGQELSEDKLDEVVSYLRYSESFFSAGFNEALKDHEFSQPIREIIRYSFSDWDGSVPKRSVGDNSPKGSVSHLELGLSLVVSPNVPLSVSPRWHLPSLQDRGDFELEFSGLKWPGRFCGTEAISSRENEPLDKNIWMIASNSHKRDHNFELRCTGVDDIELSRFSLLLPNTRLWILVPSWDAINGQLELKPSELPANGVAYLLAPPNNTVNLKHYLEQQQTNAEIIELEPLGVPDDWMLLCVKDCSDLSDEQRCLPDGKPHAHPKPNIIRLLGGKAVQRGYTKMYLPYDLPSIELDAPEGVHLISNGGIRFNEELPNVGLYQPKELNIRELHLNKRFSIKLPSMKSASYEIKACSSNGDILGRVRFKVAGLNGDVVQTDGSFSLDPFGKPLASDKGLVGARIGQATDDVLSHEFGDCCLLKASELGAAVLFGLEDSCIYRQFLDALAQSNGLDYGTSKRLITRLMRSHDYNFEAIFLLLELQRRGHVELSTTKKGNTARVQAISPCLYSLPVTVSGKAVWAITGTLRLQHWQSIAAEQEAWRLYEEKPVSSGMSIWRLVINDEKKAKKIAETLGLEFIELPSSKIASWSGSFENFKEQALRNTLESVGNAEDEAIRFIPSKGSFEKKPKGELPDIWELWKLQDLDVRFDNVHVLVNQGQHAFVRDASWGKWLAIHEFAKKFSFLPHLKDIYPPPLNFDSRRGTIWVPARLGLPRVLERALVLCSGCSPIVESLRKQDRQFNEEKSLLCNELTGSPLLLSNIFYDEMADGKWLAYHHVPEQIAHIVAQKLGAKLDINRL